MLKSSDTCWLVDLVDADNNCIVPMISYSDQNKRIVPTVCIGPERGVMKFREEDIDTIFDCKHASDLRFFRIKKMSGNPSNRLVQ